MLGIVDALMQLLLQGQRLRPAQGQELGLVDEVVATRDELVPAAKAWIAAQPRGASSRGTSRATRSPAARRRHPTLAANLPAFPANLRKQLKGANYPAPHHIMAAAVEGAQVDFDTALEIEGRYFVDLVDRPGREEHDPGVLLRPAGGQRRRAAGRRTSSRSRSKKVVVLGAGMMGAAIAYVCAKAGIEVVLKDVSTRRPPNAARATREKLVAKGVERGKTTQEKGDALLALHHADRPTPAAAAGADLVIEAVFEDPEVKAQVFAEIEPHLADGRAAGLEHLDAADHRRWPRASRARPTSSGCTSSRPVDKMPLLEIIKGEQTSDETLYRALDVAKQIGKTPIVVNDSRGFFTSRVIGTFINEGIAMLAEGVPAPSIEQASSQAGYPAPVLQLTDELNLKLMRKIRKAAQGGGRGRGRRLGRAPGRARSSTACSTSSSRPGKLEGAGFYEYADGKRTGLWPGLREAFPPVADPSSISLKDLEERMLFVEAHRDGEVPRRGRDRVGRRREHRLDHGHRLPGLDRRRAAVHQRLRRAARRRASSPARASWPSTYGERFDAARLAGRAGRARRAVPRRHRRPRLSLAQSPGAHGVRRARLLTYA